LLDDIIPPAPRLLKEGKIGGNGTILTPDPEFEKLGLDKGLKSLEMVH
jgi:hypothetical protein